MSDHRLSSEAELRERYGPPSKVVGHKVIDRLEEHSRRFISLSPFCCLGSSDAEGRGDVSPRGDRPGFVRVLDDRRLFLPDRPGNNRIDSMRNILEQPYVGLLFLIPGVYDVLRVNGRAEVVASPELLEASAVDDKLPKSGIVVHVEERCRCRPARCLGSPRWCATSSPPSSTTSSSTSSPRSATWRSSTSARRRSPHRVPHQVR